MGGRFATQTAFDPADELPLRPGQEGSYRTETFNQWVHDPVANIGLNIWFAAGQHGSGRQWPCFVSTLTVYEADGRLFARSTGEGNHAQGVAGGDGFLTLVEPFRRWRIDYAGLVRPDRPGGEEATPVLCTLALDLACVAPPIEQGTQGDRGVEASSGTRPRIGIRYEQLCRATGPVRIGDRAFQLDALGVRSHRRNSASIYESGAVGHSWATGLFQDGRGFQILSRRREPDGDVGFLYGHWFDGTRHHAMEVLRFPFYSGAGDAERFTLQARVNGATLTIEGETMPPRLSDIPPQRVGLSQSTARFRMGDAIGGGVLERSLLPRFAAGGEFRAEA